MTLILTIIGAFLPTILQKFGVISPSIASLISDLTAAIPDLIAKLKADGTPSTDELALLSAFQAEIQVLQKDSTLDPSDLAVASALDAALTEALAAYKTAETVTDPSNLTPLPTDVQDVPAVDEPDPNPTAPIS